MLHFSIFHLFFSHQHVQIITGPHEKKWCGKNFWGPFLNKIYFFQQLTGPSKPSPTDFIFLPDYYYPQGQHMITLIF